MEFLAHLALYTKVCEAPTYTHVFPYFEHGMIVFVKYIPAWRRNSEFQQSPAEPKFSGYRLRALKEK